MLYGNSKEIPILSPAEAVLKSFQSAQLNAANDWLALSKPRLVQHRHLMYSNSIGQFGGWEEVSTAEVEGTIRAQ